MIATVSAAPFTSPIACIPLCHVLNISEGSFVDSVAVYLSVRNALNSMVIITWFMFIFNNKWSYLNSQTCFFSFNVHQVIFELEKSGTIKIATQLDLIIIRTVELNDYVKK